jgi:hypothetical protein
MIWAFIQIRDWERSKLASYSTVIPVQMDNNFIIVSIISCTKALPMGVYQNQNQNQTPFGFGFGSFHCTAPHT